MAIIDKIQLSGTVYTIGNETTTAVTSASTDNEIPTAKAVYDAIPQGGGGKAIEAGTNISITTGETADTINCTLNASNGSGNYSFVVGRTNFANKWCSYAEGEQNLAGGTCSHAEGSFTYANANYSHTEGYQTNANNMYEHASGTYNVSNSASTTFGDSRNTLFSVGNGKYANKEIRHNAFEIRQNGDIYIADTNDTSTTNYYEKPMIKLQDALGGGGGASITIDPSLDSGSTNPVANSAITTAFNTYTALKDYLSGTVRYWSWRTPNHPYGNGVLWNFAINGKCPLSQENRVNSDIWQFNLVETSAITTSVTSSSTDTQVPSAKAVYDIVGNIETLLSKI